MTTLFDVMLRLARELDEVWESTATGGSATTLVDTKCTEPDDYWNTGSLFMITNAATAVQNTVITPTDWAKTTATLTIPTITPASIAAGNKYLLLKAKWPRASLVRAVNVALAKQWLISQDETLTVVDSKLVYTLPTGVSRVMQVWLGNDTDGWEQHHFWAEENGELRFAQHEPGSDETVRLRYRTLHSTVGADSDTIDNQIRLDLLQWDALAELHRWRYYLVGEQEKNEVELVKFCEAMAMRYRVTPTQPAPRYAGW